jgi:hypothetical protein
MRAVLRRTSMERETGIEPAPSAWKAEVLPLNYSRPGNVTPLPTASRRHRPPCGRSGNEWRERHRSGLLPCAPPGPRLRRVPDRFPAIRSNFAHSFRWFETTSRTPLHTLKLVEGGGLLRAPALRPSGAAPSARSGSLPGDPVELCSFVSVVRNHLANAVAYRETGGGRWIAPGILPCAPPGPRLRRVPDRSCDPVEPWSSVSVVRTHLTNAVAYLETGGGRWIRTTEGVSQQIYSLPPLAAWVSLRNGAAHSHYMTGHCQQEAAVATAISWCLRARCRART